MVNCTQVWVPADDLICKEGVWRENPTQLPTAAPLEPGVSTWVVGATSTAVGTTWLVITVAHCYSKHKETLHRLWESF